MPQADLSVVKPVIAVTTSYTDRERMLLIPGSAWKAQEGVWHVPLSWASCVVLRSVFGGELKLGPALVEWARKERQRVARAMELRDMLELPPDSPGARVIDEIERGSELKLLPFQRADVAYLVTMEQDCLFAPMGAGKTAVSIRTLQVLKALGRDPFPAVIVAPNSVKTSVWPSELARWAPELSVSVVDGGAAARRKQIAKRADITIINWESVPLHSRVSGYGDIRLTDKDKELKELNELNPRTVIMDEAARLRNPETKQWRAVKFLAHQARYRIALTGTPVNDNAVELWGILHVVRPDWHPVKGKYTDRWVETGYSLYGGLMVLGLRPGTVDEFRAVTQPLFRRIPKEIILPQLPPKLPPVIRHTPMSPAQARAYREMEQLQLAQLNDLMAAPNKLTQLTRLMQFAATTVHIDRTWTDENDKTRYDISLIEPSCKVDDLVELLDEMGGDPLVVAVVSSKLADLAAERLKSLGISCGVISGRVPPAERPAIVSKFQSGELRVIFIVLAAGAEGITLTRARVICFMQEDWRPDLNDQAVDRIHRIGSEVHQSVQVVKQITPGTVEERKPLVLAGKYTRIEDTLADKDTLRRLLGG